MQLLFRTFIDQFNNISQKRKRIGLVICYSTGTSKILYLLFPHVPIKQQVPHIPLACKSNFLFRLDPYINRVPTERFLIQRLQNYIWPSSMLPVKSRITKRLQRSEKPKLCVASNGEGTNAFQDSGTQLNQTNVPRNS